MSIIVDTSSLSAMSLRAKRISTSVASCTTTIKGARNSLPSKVLNKYNIGYDLKSVCDEIDIELIELVLFYPYQLIYTVILKKNSIYSKRRNRGFLIVK